MKFWKLLGLAAAIGIAASGTAVALRRRHWRHYDAEELREGLHARLAEVADR
ncbi:MAG: hypothetical protein ACFCVK_12915 [Acidimicrobiales bacterium]